ncbi:zinc transporter ZIP11 [Patella vulgata]|uniref:zinc transporter ZIP11 n=1 Tax=Patella vulgata TaxID=6465 RepID=UPI00218067F3|nr:zinc transporter ZIP11 [Patella vulgata]
MIQGINPVYQAFLGTLLTWGLTALGSALVFVFQSGQRKILDGSLGFAAGVMTAASYWSLLAPAIETAEQSGLYGVEGQWAFVPVAIGFALGAVFVYGADVLMPYLGFTGKDITSSLDNNTKLEKDGELLNIQINENEVNSRGKSETTRLRRPGTMNSSIPTRITNDDSSKKPAGYTETSWKRILLLIIAVTIHNIPEGLAVGVGFGAVGKTKTATFESARNLAIGIGIQNFPEGLAVSLPLRGSGMSLWKCFWYGQLSGLVEPIAGVLGAAAIVIAEPLLPYALAFAAGAMIYVVVDDIIPEAQTCGNGKLASWGAVVGFIVMMSLDVGLG